MLIVLFCRQLYRVMYNLLCLQCRTLFIIVLLLGSFAILVYEHCVIIQAVKTCDCCVSRQNFVGLYSRKTVYRCVS